ncbi:MAG: glycosyltransferase [Muribaculaceae bacterium]|nr:glycosyltransferase [Muribaculaceae bacterium]
MILAIISHTEHYLDSKGNLVGWGATVREINNLVEIFDKVIHIAPLHGGKAPAGMLPYESKNIIFRPLRPSGGKTISDKLSIITSFPHNLKVISESLREADVFQFRAPTGIGVLLIPYLLRHSKKGWFKYAGNWVQEKPPVGYRIQRWMLNSQSDRIVTINGHWSDQKPNQLSFENPCLTDEERKKGKRTINEKDYSGKLNFVFIGRLEDEKGVQRILNVFSRLDNSRIGALHFVGDGPKRKVYEEFAYTHSMKNVVFHGYLTRKEIDVLLEQSHIFLLPSYASEGFPKVIAEAANFGVIPIVSDVSSIGQYVIEGKNGYIVKNAEEDTLRLKVCDALGRDQHHLSRLAVSSHEMAANFTYAHYNSRILNEITGVDRKR